MPGGAPRMIYAHIDTEGKRTPVVSDGPLGLERLQALVGGYIEMVALPDGTELVINEEGRLHGLPRNPVYPFVVGPVVVGRATSDGEFVGIL